ncbi:hypothetical protein EZ313_13460 [Ramlibacter henchirensis]|uniref:Lipoprotein n=1 Tax=Ramlibacter henchirensis TaxID=204072 RepID=A0A4Z0BSK3_9BURK|nr:hypothetical protein [Ramlibacter henchirensis]TFZ02276.1 hypothetical protein EZ313_13460 [Ramlibacter henchirensis]
MERWIPIFLLLTALAGCGWFERKVTANVTGHAIACIDGVRYLQFPSGVTVQYDREGRVRTC